MDRDREKNTMKQDCSNYVATHSSTYTGVFYSVQEIYTLEREREEEVADVVGGEEAAEKVSVVNVNTVKIKGSCGGKLCYTIM